MTLTHNDIFMTSAQAQPTSCVEIYASQKNSRYDVSSMPCTVIFHSAGVIFHSVIASSVIICMKTRLLSTLMETRLNSMNTLHFSFSSGMYVKGDTKHGINRLHFYLSALCLLFV